MTAVLGSIDAVLFATSAKKNCTFCTAVLFVHGRKFPWSGWGRHQNPRPILFLTCACFLGSIAGTLALGVDLPRSSCVTIPRRSRPVRLKEPRAVAQGRCLPRRLRHAKAGHWQMARLRASPPAGHMRAPLLPCSSRSISNSRDPAEPARARAPGGRGGAAVPRSCACCARRSGAPPRRQGRRERQHPHQRDHGRHPGTHCQPRRRHRLHHLSAAQAGHKRTGCAVWCAAAPAVPLVPPALPATMCARSLQHAHPSMSAM